MTTNQTIDGVPRDRLEDAARAAQIAGYTGLAEELRALLEAPAEEQQWVSVEAFNRVSAELEELKASRSQGEPVAWQYRVSAGPQTGWSLWGPGKGDEYAEHYTVETRPLYAEQPAPVAVVPDGFMLVERGIWTEDQVESAAKCITMLKVVPGMTDRDLAMAAMDAGQCKAPEITLADFACLDELERLNTARPAHANPPPGTEPCGTHRDNDGLDEMRKPQSEQARRAVLLESLAKQVYQSWESQPGFVPWVDGGNSLKQDEARQIASRTFELALANQVGD